MHLLGSIGFKNVYPHESNLSNLNNVYVFILQGCFLSLGHDIKCCGHYFCTENTHFVKDFLCIFSSMYFIVSLLFKWRSHFLLDMWVLYYRIVRELV